MRTQVAIIGGGPSGLLAGSAVCVAKASTTSSSNSKHQSAMCWARIRAGVSWKPALVELLHEAGVGGRMDRECFVHDGTLISYGDDLFGINFKEHTDTSVVVYGQTEVTRDLYEAREATGAPIVYNTDGVTIHGADSDTPYITYTVDGAEHRLDCDFVAGCDGFHGVSRQTIPLDVRREYEKVYPFGWLGILSETPPVNDELIYASSDRGFALCSMRNANLSRYYIQCSLSDSPDDWTDASFWDELRRRIPASQADALVTGPSIEKSIAPLRSFVTEPMRWGRLFLCGDAAHIVPPTGAKGLNTAASDVHYLYHGLVQHFHDHDDEGIDRYSERALARVWKAERFSWWFTNLMHRYPDQSEFDLKMQQAEIAFLRDNRDAQAVMAQNYVGLPY
jgi:p-hydroxybenzoate 3-monooxygenase